MSRLIRVVATWEFPVHLENYPEGFTYENVLEYERETRILEDIACEAAAKSEVWSLVPKEDV